MPGIKYVSYHDLDKQKWDDCIASSVNGLIYAKSFFLDAVAAQWDAVILNDYEAVMPVCCKQKWGIKYLYQPAFIQQGGIYFKMNLAQDIPFLFFITLHKHFAFAEINLNYANPAVTLPGFTFRGRNNYIIDLKRSYDIISSAYSKNAAQELRRLKKFNLKYIDSADTDEAIEMYRQLYGQEMSYSKSDYEHFKTVCKNVAIENKVFVRQVRDEENELLALVLLLKDEHRMYNIISCILPEGKKYSANYFLYDELVKEFSGQSLLLDFEGSDVEGIKYFYEKFTQVNQSYLFMKYNRLPWPIKLFKK
ncbi:MAG: GNAT family N-acetyltransferase [Ferruginibacter sp.]